MRFDESGVTWLKRFPNTISIEDITELSNRNIAILSREYGALGTYLTVLDPMGNLVWAKKIDSETAGLGSTGKCIISTADGNLLVCSELTGDVTTPINHLITKLGLDGELIWEKEYQTPEGVKEKFNTITESSTGDLYLVGFSDSVDLSAFSYSDVVVRKLDATGTYLDGQIYGYEYKDEGYDIVEMKDNNFALIGLSKPQYTCSGNMLLFKITPSLDVVFTRHYGNVGGTGAFYPYINRSNDTYYSYGYGSLWGNGIGHLIKLDLNLELPCMSYMQELETAQASSFTTIPSSSVHSTFTPTVIDGIYNALPALLSENACTGEPLTRKEQEEIQFNIYPNPGSGRIIFEVENTDLYNSSITIHSITGREIKCRHSESS